MPQKTTPRRFHVEHGPAPLFDRARTDLDAIESLRLEIHHFQQRVEERAIPLEPFTEFRPEGWLLVTVETSDNGGRIHYMSIRRRLDDGTWLWAVLAGRHVVTAFVRENSGTGRNHPQVIQDGSVWGRVRTTSLRLMEEEERRGLRAARRAAHEARLASAAAAPRAAPPEHRWSRLTTLIRRTLNRLPWRSGRAPVPDPRAKAEP